MPLTLEIATHVYIAILTDTGSFHYSQHHAADLRHLPAVHRGRRRARRPSRAAIFDSNNLGRAEAVRRGAERDAARRRAAGSPRSASITSAGRATAAAPTKTPKGSINLPLTVKEIQAVVFFKEAAPATGASACARRARSTSTRSPRSSAAAATRTRPAAAPQGTLDELTPLFEQKLTRADRTKRNVRQQARGSACARRLPVAAAADSLHGRRPRHRQAAGADVARRGRGGAARARERASATPARSIRWRPACCRWPSAGPRGSCASSPASDKDYDATIRFGVTTDTLRRHRHRDRAGATRQPIARRASTTALATLRGDVPADAAGVLGQEGRRPAGLRAGAPGRAGRR